MIRKRLFVLTACLLVLALSLTGCKKNDSDKDKTSSKKSLSGKKNSVKSSNGKSDFINDVQDACHTVDPSVFTDVSNTPSDGDTDAVIDSFEAAENELDKLISELEDIDVPSEHEDDWDTLLDDFSALRDAFPDLATALRDINDINEDLETTTDPDLIADAQTELLRIQSDIEALSDDLQQRVAEIEEITDRLDIKDACDLS